MTEKKQQDDKRDDGKQKSVPLEVPKTEKKGGTDGTGAETREKKK